MLLARVVRSGQIEASHLGAIHACDLSGRALLSRGEIDRRFFFRSAIKPLQATVCLEAEADCSVEELAVACSSHGGHPVHVALVRTLLAGAGLSDADLQTPPAWPLDPVATRQLVAAGGRRPQPIYHNCSGKHALMLRACVAAGWPTHSYTDPDHPLQVRILRLVAEVTDGEGEPVGVDGCGAPAFAGTVRGLANAFAHIAGEGRFDRVRSAMHRFAPLAGNRGRVDSDLAIAVNGVAKVGAVGCLGVALSGRMGLAVKCWDGSDRAAGVGAIEALGRLVDLPPAVAAGLAVHARPPVLGGGRVVGAVEPAF